MYKNINVTKVMEYNLVITISFHHLSRLSYELDLEEDLTVAWTGLYPLFKSNNWLFASISWLLELFIRNRSRYRHLRSLNNFE